MPQPLLKKQMRVTFALVLAGVSAFILWFLPPSLLVLATTATGGDTGSHTATAFFLKNTLLPSGNLTGWTMGNLGGFPLLQNYFFFPFFLMALLSRLIPLEIAFKLVSVAGIFGLPFAVHFFFRKITGRETAISFPVPEAAAIFTLPYLFMEGQSIWGGNIASSLSGAFCYAMGLCFALVFLGLLYEHFTGKSHFILCPLVLALTGFCHGYTLLYSGFASLFFLLMPGRFKENFASLVLIHGTAIGLMAFWLIPLIRCLPWTTPFGFVWDFQTPGRFMDQVFPPVTRPFVLFSLASLAVWAVRTYRNRETGLSRFSPAPFFLAYLALTGLALYAVGAALKLVDIRFLPFFQLFAVVSGAMAFIRFKADSRTLVFILLCTMAAVMLWVDSRETHIRNWAVHNNRGFENTPLWNDVKAVADVLKGSENDPRVAYEHSTVYEQAGTLRVMESLPFFSGRSTLEGVYIQASILSPAIYTLQAEISQHPSMPLVEYDYPAFDLDAALNHLKLFNVSHLILAEPESRKAAWNNPSYRSVLRKGPFEVFQVMGNSGAYVEPLKYRPVLISGPDFRKPFHRWFRNPQNNVFLVYDENPGPEDTRRFAKPPALKPLPPLNRPVRSRVGQNEILIEQAAIGHPLLVKVSYHPNWKAKGADRIYPVSPGFMLIYPRSETVLLTYGPSLTEHLGGVLSLVTVVAMVIVLCIRFFPSLRLEKDTPHA